MSTFDHNHADVLRRLNTNASSFSRFKICTYNHRIVKKPCRMTKGNNALKMWLVKLHCPLPNFLTASFPHTYTIFTYSVYCISPNVTRTKQQRESFKPDSYGTISIKANSMRENCLKFFPGLFSNSTWR